MQISSLVWYIFSFFMSSIWPHEIEICNSCLHLAMLEYWPCLINSIPLQEYIRNSIRYLVCNIIHVGNSNCEYIFSNIYMIPLECSLSHSYSFVNFQNIPIKWDKKLHCLLFYINVSFISRSSLLLQIHYFLSGCFWNLTWSFAPRPCHTILRPFTVY